MACRQIGSPPAGVMETPNRRAFFAISAGGLCAFHCTSKVAAAVPFEVASLSSPARIDLANALNFRLFIRSKNTLGLTAVMAMRPVDGTLGNYPAGSLFLFPFMRGASNANESAFLPGTSVASPLIETAPMMTLGLAPDEFFCHYVLKAPWQSFIGCALDAPIAREIGPGPWHSNVTIGDETIGVCWTSSNLNDRWFDGSRWIPESDDGNAWRARIVQGVRHAATMTC